MEHQSWSIQNQFTFKEFLIAHFVSRWKLFSIPLLYIVLCVWLLKIYVWHWVLLYSFFLLLVIVFVSTFLLRSFFVYRKIKRVMPATLEINPECYKNSSPLGFDSVIQWSAIKKIYRRYGFIFIEFDLGLEKHVLIPFRIFKDQAEGEQFYADLNHFWEQGR